MLLPHPTGGPARRLPGALRPGLCACGRANPGCGPRGGAARLVPGQRAAGRDRGGGGAAPRRTRPEAPLPAQRPGAAGRRATRRGSSVRLEHRLAVAPRPAGRDAVSVPALGPRAAGAWRVGAAARGDGRDPGRGALPRPRAARPPSRQRSLRSSRSPSTAALSPCSGTRRCTTRGSPTATTVSTGACSAGSTSAGVGPEARPRRSIAGRPGGLRARRTRRREPASRATRRPRAGARAASRTAP